MCIGFCVLILQNQKFDSLVHYDPFVVWFFGPVKYFIVVLVRFELSTN